MHFPPQGFRHAATLLLTNRIRAISEDASPASVGDTLGGLAEELVELASDMRVSPESRWWLFEEYSRSIARLRCAFDDQAVKEHAARTFENVGVGIREYDACDLFLIYVPEDRLPTAAPLAIALAKRRLSVAFSPYEVATPEELVTAIDAGLRLHAAGVVLGTPAFDRAGLRPHVVIDPRLRVLSPNDASRPEELIRWSASLKHPSGA